MAFGSNPQQRALQRGIDLKYGKQQITASVTSSILQGKGIGKIADDLQSRMQDMSRASAIRTARTAITAAQNAGRLDSYKAAQDMGIELKKQWLATLDNRTRHAHAVLDGQTVDVDKPFKVDGYEIMYPGDSSAPGYLVYNCRCTQVAVLDDVDTSGGMRRARDPVTGESVLVKDMTYVEWAGWKKSEHFDKLNYRGEKSEAYVKNIENVLLKLPESHRKAAESIIPYINITNSDRGSRYNRKTGVVDISTKSPPYSIVHEYGHALADAKDIENNSDFVKTRISGLENIKFEDIIIDTESFSDTVLLIESEKFISKYQGRIYADLIDYSDPKTITNGMADYFAEGYREFIENPENLKSHDPELYEFIRSL